MVFLVLLFLLLLALPVHVVVGQRGFRLLEFIIIMSIYIYNPFQLYKINNSMAASNCYLLLISC